MKTKVLFISFVLLTSMLLGGCFGDDKNVENTTEETTEFFDNGIGFENNDNIIDDTSEFISEGITIIGDTITDFTEDVSEAITR